MDVSHFDKIAQHQNQSDSIGRPRTPEETATANRISSYSGGTSSSEASDDTRTSTSSPSPKSTLKHAISTTNDGEKRSTRPTSFATGITLTTINEPSNISSIAASTSSPTSTRPSLPTLLSFSALTLSIFLVALDTVLIPTALPSISLDFYIPDSLYAWTGGAYLLANAASIPFWGKLSDVFGRKSVILIANSIFLVGSIICALSGSANMLVGGRTVQGLGGGGVNVLVYVCVADLFAIRDRSFFMGIVGAMYAVASALGPVLGGVFAQKLNWRWCFYINLPLVSIAIITLYFTIHLHDPRTPLFAGTVLLLVGLQQGGTSSYDAPLTLAFLIIAALAYIAFLFTQRWEERRVNGSPIMPLRIFRDISNLSALGVCACDALVFNSVAYFLPLYFQLVLEVSPERSGVLMLAVAVPLALVSFLGGWIINRTGRYLEVLQAGLALMTVGVGLLTMFTTSFALGKIIGFLVVIGVGFGPNFHAPLTALQTRIQESDMASGTSTFGFVRMVSGAIGVVVGQVVFQLFMRPHISRFTDAGIDVNFARALAGGQSISQAERIASLPGDQQLAVRSGMTSALKGVWIFYTVVSGLGLLVSFGIARKQLANEKEVKGGLLDPESVMQSGELKHNCEK